MTERAGYLPGLDTSTISWREERFGPSDAPQRVLMPVLEGAHIDQLSQHVRHNARAKLKAMPVGQIVDAIDRTIARLLDRTDPHRQRMEAVLPKVTDYDPEMVRLGLTEYLKTFRKPQLQRFLSEDFPNPAILDDFQPLTKGGFGRAVGPDLLGHIWAGNVPGLPIWSLIAGLLVKAGNLGKAPSNEPLFAGWFAESLAQTEPALADCLAVAWWRGGDAEPEAALLKEADLMLAYGNNTSLAAIQSRMPTGKRCLAYGHKVSFAMIGRAALDPSKAQHHARAAAYDIARYNQQGCYSPHMIFVEHGGAVTPARFAQYVAHELAALEHKFPRRPLDINEAQAVAAWRMEEGTRQGGTLIGATEGGWSVSYQAEDTSFQPSPLNRAIRVVAIDDLANVAPIVAPYRALLQTVAIAAPPRDLFALGAALGAIGVTRVCALGDMTSPEAGWHHDGRFNLLDLVQITEIDARAERAADRVAPYAD